MESHHGCVGELIIQAEHQHKENPIHSLKHAQMVNRLPQANHTPFMKAEQQNNEQSQLVFAPWLYPTLFTCRLPDLSIVLKLSFISFSLFFVIARLWNNSSRRTKSLLEHGFIAKNLYTYYISGKNGLLYPARDENLLTAC